MPRRLGGGLRAITESRQYPSRGTQRAPILASWTPQNVSRSSIATSTTPSASRLSGRGGAQVPSNGSVIPLAARGELEQEPTGREIEVLQLISDGLVNREIGQRLYLSEETVKSHVRHLLAKLQARSRAHAVAVGFRRGIIG